MLKLSKKYFPENYVVLKEYDEATINEMAEGNSLGGYVYDIPTVVHEGYHAYTGVHSDYDDSVMIYRINDTLSFYVKTMKTFPAREINAIVPDSLQNKIFRYKTYVDAKDKYLVTQQFGILGLLEEMTAYYQSYHTSVALFNYLKDNGWKNSKPYLDYLGRIASYRYSIAEFELFISWYLQYARLKYPSVYKNIVSNKELKQMLSFIHNENAKLASQYNRNLQEILQRFSKQLVTGKNFIYNKENLTGTGLYDTEYKEMNDLLARPEHNDYRKLLQ